MAAAILHIADAVVALLNGGSYAESFTAARVVDPILKLENLSTLNVSVLARKTNVAIESRSGIETVLYAIDVAIRKKLAASTLRADHDKLQWVAEQVMDRLSKNPLTGRSETLVEISTDATGESDPDSGGVTGYATIAMEARWTSYLRASASVDLPVVRTLSGDQGPTPIGSFRLTGHWDVAGKAKEAPVMASAPALRY